MVNILPRMNAEEKILLALAQNNNQTHYQLWKKHQVASSNKTVLATLKRLEKEEMIESRQETTGRKRKFYNLTFNGLIICLKHEAAWGSIDQIAEAQKEMVPLLFVKWDFFKEEKIIDEIIQRFKEVVDSLWDNMTAIAFLPKGIHDFRKLLNGKFNQVLCNKYKIIQRKPFAGVPIRQLLFTSKVFGITHTSLLPMNSEKSSPSIEKQKNLLQVLQRDSELKNYIGSILEIIEIGITLESENIRCWRKWFQQLERNSDTLPSIPDKAASGPLI